MVNKLNRYLLINIFTLLLVGCIAKQVEQSSLALDSVQPKLEQSYLAQREIPLISKPVIPQNSKINKTNDEIMQQNSLIHYYNWNDAIKLMISKMLQTNGINFNCLLLVNNISNYTNGTLNTIDAMRILSNTLEYNSNFVLVSEQQLSLAKEKLGLSLRDSLDTRNKAIGIARNLGAQYILYSDITGNVNTPLLQIKLILIQTKTGEIIWSDKTIVKRK